MDISIWTKGFWVAALERAIRTAAQAALLAVGSDALISGGIDVTQVSWAHVGSLALGGFVLAVLTSLTVHAVTGNGPAINNAETLTSTLAVGPQDPTAPTTQAGATSS